jgi:Family of unknown function (DUF6232)
MHMTTEKTYSQQGDITVTSARFIVGSQTFAMRNITSVQIVENKPNNPYPGYLMIIGCVTALIGFSNSSISAGILGLVIAAAGVYWAWHQTSTFSVVLTTAAGEVSAYTSQNRKFIATIVEALNLSIAERG